MLLSLKPIVEKQEEPETQDNIQMINITNNSQIPQQCRLTIEHIQLLFNDNLNLINLYLLQNLKVLDISMCNLQYHSTGKLPIKQFCRYLKLILFAQFAPYQQLNIYKLFFNTICDKYSYQCAALLQNNIKIYCIVKDNSIYVKTKRIELSRKVIYSKVIIGVYSAIDNLFIQHTGSLICDASDLEDCEVNLQFSKYVNFGITEQNYQQLDLYGEQFKYFNENIGQLHQNIDLQQKYIFVKLNFLDSNFDAAFCFKSEQLLQQNDDTENVQQYTSVDLQQELLDYEKEQLEQKQNVIISKTGTQLLYSKGEYFDYTKNLLQQLELEKQLQLNQKDNNNFHDSDEDLVLNNKILHFKNTQLSSQVQVNIIDDINCNELLQSLHFKNYNNIFELIINNELNKSGFNHRIFVSRLNKYQIVNSINDQLVKFNIQLSQFEIIQIVTEFIEQFNENNLYNQKLINNITMIGFQLEFRIVVQNVQVQELVLFDYLKQDNENKIQLNDNLNNKFIFYYTQYKLQSMQKNDMYTRFLLINNIEQQNQAIEIENVKMEIQMLTDLQIDQQKQHLKLIFTDSSQKPVSFQQLLECYTIQVEIQVNYKSYLQNDDLKTDIIKIDDLENAYIINTNILLIKHVDNIVYADLRQQLLIQ